MVYVAVVVPSCAVIMVVMVLAPAVKAMEADELPVATVAPFTVIVAVGSAGVGNTVIDDVAFGTLAV